MAKPLKKQAKPVKKTVKTVSETKPATQQEKPLKPEGDQKPEPQNVDLNKTNVKQAISDGMAIIKDGKSKADAARAIFGMLKDEPKEVIVAAFVEGATLTEKGALTYWYNCKRKAEKPPKEPGT